MTEPNPIAIVSVRVIARETGLSRRTVQRALRDLEAEGAIRKIGQVAYELRLPGLDDPNSWLNDE
jgi:DNA-binding transcriptional regulator YhcF (GntR family)